jgi:hypothetical protein
MEDLGDEGNLRGLEWVILEHKTQLEFSSCIRGVFGSRHNNHPLGDVFPNFYSVWSIVTFHEGFEFLEGKVSELTRRKK